MPEAPIIESARRAPAERAAPQHADFWHLHAALRGYQSEIQTLAYAGLALFTIGGLALIALAALIANPAPRIAIATGGLALAIFARFHHAWFLRHPRLLRSRMRTLEQSAGVEAYRVTAPRWTLAGRTVRYRYALDAITAVIATAAIIVAIDGPPT